MARDGARPSARWALAAASSLALAAGLTANPVHPRLVFGPHEIPALREKVRHEPWSLMYQKLQDDLWMNNNGRATIDWSASAGELAWPGTRAAFLYVITGDDSYAQIARQASRRTLDDPLWGKSSTKGLTLYSYAYRVALMYDWCHDAPSWDAAFREEVSTKLRDMADLIVDNGGTEQNTSPASNWQGIRGAAAAWTYLAIDTPYDPARFEKAYNRVVTFLQQNLGTSANGRGWNIEGLGYTYYPMGDFIGAYGYAQWRNDPTRDLRTVTPAAPWNFWTVYATAMHMPGQTGPVHPDFGDDNALAFFSGTLGQAFWWLPEEFHPGMLYTYDMLVGPDGDQTWDNGRAGTIWSILFHPGWIAEQAEPDLLPSWQDGYIETGGNGYITWRKGTDSVEDIVAQVYAKLRGNMGHSGPDGLGFRIIGLDNAWAVGGGRYGLKINNQDAYLHSMNSLYPVAPGTTLAISGDSGSFVGQPVVEPDGSGHAVMRVARSNLNVSNWTRRFAADHSGRAGAEAVYVISDTSGNGTFWQMVTHEDNSITTSGNAFTIHGANGHRMEGTVLHPASPVFTTGTRIRGSTYNSFATVPSNNNDFVHFSSADGDYLVVLTILRNGAASPAVTAAGTWSGDAPAGTVNIGPLSLEVAGDSVAWQENRMLPSTNLLEIAEGGSAAIGVQLSAQPAAPVTVAPTLLVEPGAAERFTIDPAGLPIVFDAANWNTPQPVTVHASADADGVHNRATLRLYSDAETALRPLDVALQQIDAGPHPVAAWAGKGGVVTGVPSSGTAPHGSVIVLTALADPGFAFTGWSDGGTAAQRTITVDGEIALEAMFSIEGAAVLEAVADAYVRDGSYANTNYGSATELVVKHQPTAAGFNRQSFLRFALPAGFGALAKANLLLTLTGLTDARANNRVHVISGASWSEASITWNNKPAVADFVASWKPDVIGRTYSIDITAAVAAALAEGRTTIDLAVTADDLTYTAYASRESANPATRPQLQLLGPGLPPTFAEWAAAEWPGLDEAARAANADANGNGMANLLEFAVGGYDGLPAVVATPHGFRIEWRRRISLTGVDSTLQWARHPAGPWTILPAAATAASHTAGGFHVLHTQFPAQAGDGPVFFRLQVNVD